MKLAVDRDVTTIEILILNRTNGSENGMLYSNVITGAVYTAVPVRLRFITRDMQKEILERNRFNGSFQFVNRAMTNSTDDIVANKRDHYGGHTHRLESTLSHLS